MANGPTIIAARGVPQGCEQEPVTGAGRCMAEMTNTATPTMARNGLSGKIFPDPFFYLQKPRINERSSDPVPHGPGTDR